MILHALFACAVAAAAAEPSLLKNRPETALVDETIELRPIDGHHFNPEAPQRCGGERPQEVLPSRVRCQLKKAGKVPVTVSVCDDAQTFCRQESFEVTTTGVSKDAAKSSPVKAAPKGKPAPEGFIDNEPAKARALARREGRLLFIDFYGIWCPPCNQLDEEAYPTPEFQAASAEFVKIGLDADAETSFDWKTHFRVGGYPTLIVADSALRELGRIEGSRSGPALAKFLNEVKAYRNEPVEEAAEIVAKGGPKADELRRFRVAHWRVARGEFAEAEKLLAGMTNPYAKRELLLSRLESARLKGDDAGRVAALKELTAAFPKDSNFPQWADTLAGLDKAAATPLREAVFAAIDQWTASPLLGETDYNAADLAAIKASFVEQTVSTEEAKGLWSKAADAYASLAATSPLKTPRAENFGRAEALINAGRNSDAKALYETLIAAYPNEFTFNFGYARVLRELGELPAAYGYAQKAEAASYGDNWLRAIHLKAQLELKLGRPADAAKTLDDAFARIVAPKSPLVRTGRHLQALRALRRDVDAAKKTAQ